VILYDADVSQSGFKEEVDKLKLYGINMLLEMDTTVLMAAYDNTTLGSFFNGNQLEVTRRAEPFNNFTLETGAIGMHTPSNHNKADHLGNASHYSTSAYFMVPAVLLAGGLLVKRFGRTAAPAVTATAGLGTALGLAGTGVAANAGTGAIVPVPDAKLRRELDAVQARLKKLNGKHTHVEEVLAKKTEALSNERADKLKEIVLRKKAEGKVVTLQAEVAAEKQRTASALQTAVKAQADSRKTAAECRSLTSRNKELKGFCVTVEKMAAMAEVAAVVADREANPRGICCLCKDPDKLLRQVLHPCNHLCLCADCKLPKGYDCPLCRSTVEKKSKAIPC
jgi:hypothetical protein